VEQVRKALELDKSNFYLVGHSWGGILALEYALKYQENLKALIISNMDGPELRNSAATVCSRFVAGTLSTSARSIECNRVFRHRS
jgi:proline iminopeptidase